MRRRKFLALLGGATVAARQVPAQQKTPVIGFLSGGSRDSYFDFESFRQGLLETGYVHGHNLAIEYRWAETHFDRLPGLAAELVARKVDVIFSTGGVPGARAASEASATIPIIFIVGVDPVARGLVDSLAHPGGNLTGLTVFGPELNQKRLELLSELAPEARTFGVLVNPTNPTMPLTPESLPAKEQELARARGLEFRIVSGSSGAEINAAFQTITQSHIEALLIRADPLFYGRAEQLGSLARHHSIPAIHDWRKFTDAGGLISYGADLAKSMRDAGVYIGKILNGAKPGDLPVLQPSKFELVINLQSAKALGLNIPPALLARADEVIE